VKGGRGGGGASRTVFFLVQYEFHVHTTKYAVLSGGIGILITHHVLHYKCRLLSSAKHAEFNVAPIKVTN